MASLPTDRTTANTPAEHVADHNTLHATHNLIDTVGDEDDVLTVVDGAPAWAPAQSGTSVSAQSANITSDVSMPTGNTFYDGPSLSLAAGTWLLFGGAHMTSGGGWMVAKIWDGTTVYSSGGTYNATTNGGKELVLPAALVVLGSTTTVKISCGTDGGGATMKATTNVLSTGTSGTPTQLTAVKIA